MSSEPGYLPEFAPTSDDPSEYWLWVAECLKVLREMIPFGEEPEAIVDYMADEWKVERARRINEDEHSPATVEAIEKLCRTAIWPRSTMAVRFYGEKRLAFAQRQARLLATQSRKLGSGMVGIPRQNLGVVILWLAVDLYQAANVS